jgi:predicted acetyltransferase
MNAIQGQIKLIKPIRRFKTAFLSMLDEHLLDGDDYHDYELAKNDFGGYLQKLDQEAQGYNLPPGIVPMTTFWLIVHNKVVIGESRLKHFLTPMLEHHGGHIGYVIRPRQRQKGYGTLLLGLTLEKARTFGIKRVRITCDTENHGSVRIIEKNGGLLSGQVISKRTGMLISQYWVYLE